MSGSFRKRLCFAVSVFLVVTVSGAVLTADSRPSDQDMERFLLKAQVTRIHMVMSSTTYPMSVDLERKKQRLENHITALDGPLASERIVEVLEELGYADRQPQRSGIGPYLIGSAHTKLRTTVKRINMRRQGHRNSIEYHDHRFPEITVDELREKVDRLGRELDRFDRIQIRRRSDHIFEIDCR